MFWRLGVPLVMALVAVITVLIVRMHNASQVFERIVGQLDETRDDEVGRLRRERELRRSDTYSRQRPPDDPRTSTGQQ